MLHEQLPDWLDEQQPHEPEVSAAQIDSLRAVLRDMQSRSTDRLRVLEWGCGTGRVLRPIVADGCDVTGIDHDAEALKSCRHGLAGDGMQATLLEGDFLTMPVPAHAGAQRSDFDAVLCLGNTFLTIADLDDAVGLLRTAAACLAKGGIFAIDDLPGEFWPELTEGNWQAGVSEDGSAQMIWDARDSVFALRTGETVDLDSWTFKTEDRRMRLWTSGALSLACQAAGLSEPAVYPGLLVMRRSDDAGRHEVGGHVDRYEGG